MAICHVEEAIGQLEPIEWFELVLTVFETLSTIEGVCAFTQRLKKLFKRKVPKPTTFQDIIYKRNLWNHYELSQKLGFSNEDTKCLLKTFGYKWNNNKKIYEITEKEKNKRKKLISELGEDKHEIKT